MKIYRNDFFKYININIKNILIRNMNDNYEDKISSDGNEKTKNEQND